MGLFGFGSKKEKTAAAGKNDVMSLKGANNAASMKCILAAGIRGLELDVDLSGDEKVTVTHGPVTIIGENAIESYLDIKGEGMPLRPKKARHLGDQNRWVEVSTQYLDSETKVDEVMSRMDQILAEQEFLVGPLTMADAAVAGSIFALKKQGKAGQHQNIDAWLSRIEAKMPEGIRSSLMSHIN